MPKWAKVVFRIVGIVNLGSALLGLSFLLSTADSVWTGHLAAGENAPYFHSAFAVMALIQLTFIGVLLFTAIRFLQIRLSAVNLYSLIVLLLIVYDVAVGRVWLIGRGVGMSVAAATGISGGTGVFQFLFLVPLLYPIISVVFLQAIKRRYGNPPIPASALSVPITSVR